MADVDWENDRRIEHAQIVRYIDEGESVPKVMYLMSQHTKSIPDRDMIRHIYDVAEKREEASDR